LPYGIWHIATIEPGYLPWTVTRYAETVIGTINNTTVQHELLLRCPQSGQIERRVGDEIVTATPENIGLVLLPVAVRMSRKAYGMAHGDFAAR
jgi:hypothetical protein